MVCGTSQGGSVTEVYLLLPPDNVRETIWKPPASKSPGRQELPPPTTSALKSLPSGKASVTYEQGDLRSSCSSQYRPGQRQAAVQ